MSNDYGSTVRSLLPARFERMDDALRKQLAQSPGGSAGSLPGFLWHTLDEQATTSLQGALDSDVYGLMARAWCKAKEIRIAARSSLGKERKAVLLYLGKHTLTARLYPMLEVRITGVLFDELRFTLEINAELRSAELVLRQGRLVSVGIGDGAVSAQLKYDGVALHEKLKSRPVRLQPSWRLEAPGMEVVPWPESGA